MRANRNTSGIATVLFCVIYAVLNVAYNSLNAFGAVTAFALRLLVFHYFTPSLFFYRFNGTVSIDKAGHFIQNDFKGKELPCGFIYNSRSALIHS